MIIAVSIVDRHRPKGQQHVGTYCFEIDYPAAQHPGQMDFHVVDCVPEGEEEMRSQVGKLLTVETMLNPVRAFTMEPVFPCKRVACQAAGMHVGNCEHATSST